jgi:hypothetical protein
LDARLATKFDGLANHVAAAELLAGATPEKSGCLNNPHNPIHRRLRHTRRFRRPSRPTRRLSILLYRRKRKPDAPTIDGRIAIGPSPAKILGTSR